MWEEAKTRTQIKLLTSLDFVQNSKYLNRFEQVAFVLKRSDATFLHLFFSEKAQKTQKGTSDEDDDT